MCAVNSRLKEALKGTRRDDLQILSNLAIGLGRCEEDLEVILPRMITEAKANRRTGTSSRQGVGHGESPIG